MRYCSYEHIKSESSNFPDAVPFVVYKQDGHFCFAMKIGEQFTLTPWRKQNMTADETRQYYMQSKKQLKFCKENGWSNTGVKPFNPDEMNYEPLFMCLYCKNETFDISEPCPCRGVTNADRLKTTSSGIILPF